LFEECQKVPTSINVNHNYLNFYIQSKDDDGLIMMEQQVLMMDERTLDFKIKNFIGHNEITGSFYFLEQSNTFLDNYE